MDKAGGYDHIDWDMDGDCVEDFGYIKNYYDERDKYLYDDTTNDGSDGYFNDFYNDYDIHYDDDDICIVLS